MTEHDTIFHVHLRTSETIAYEAVERTDGWAVCFGPIDDDRHSPDLIGRAIPSHEIAYSDQLELQDVTIDELGGQDG